MKREMDGFRAKNPTPTLICLLNRSVSDAAYLKWARKQASVPEDEDEEDEDYEDYEQGGHSTKVNCTSQAVKPLAVQVLRQ